jgi:Raf kinase inhibitor-like YbhB/YbcL family protein
MVKKLTCFMFFIVLLAGLVGCKETSKPGDPADDPELVPPTDASLPPGVSENTSTDQQGVFPMTMSITSPAFNYGEAIPVQYSCDGENVSPDLDWFGIPAGTVTLALIMDDPDAPVGTWVHWVLYNLPVDTPGLRQGASGVGLDGKNSWNQTGYGGPCPPGGEHRYFFKLYALDTSLDLKTGATKKTLESALEGHVLGQAELMGTYSR